MALTIICGTGVRQVDYEYRYTGGARTETGSIQNYKTFKIGVYTSLNLYYDNSSTYISDGYKTPIRGIWKFNSGNEYDWSVKNGEDVSWVNGTISLYAEIGSYKVKYDWNNGIDGPLDGTKYVNKPYYIPAKKPKRSGYIFAYWTDNLGIGRWKPGDKYNRNSSVTFKAQWYEKTYFYWHGSESNDADYFQVDKRVDLAITASNWVSLCRYVNLIRGYCELSSKSYGSVSAGDEISASGYNAVSSAIQDCVNIAGGTSPPTVSKGALIRVGHYNGIGSIKDAANSVMRALK